MNQNGALISAVSMAPDLLQSPAIWNVLLALVCGLPPLLVIYHLLRKTSASTASSCSFSTAGPPGNVGLPVIGETLALLLSYYNPLGVYDFVSTRYQRYGNPFKTRIMGKVAVFIGGRDAAKFITANEHKLFRSCVPKSMTDIIGKHSLLEATGDAHSKLRRILREPFSMDSLRKHFDAMQGVAVNVLENWKDRERLCALSETTDYAFLILSSFVVSSRPGEEQEKMRSYYERISEALDVIPVNMPGFCYHKGLQARKKLHAVLSSIIRRRAEGHEKKDDLLQSLIDNQMNGTGHVLSRQEIIDNLIGILFAGHETTGIALMWAMKYIEENPAVKDKLLMEHSNFRNPKGSHDRLTWEAINGMLYTHKFINEVLRVANVVTTLLPRQALQDVEINGYIMKKGWNVVLDTRTTHLDERYFKNPQTFEPYRFEEAPKPNTFMPFGGGARMCLGMDLAKLEMTIFIHYLMISYKWCSLSSDGSLARTLFQKLKNGYPIKVEQL